MSNTPSEAKLQKICRMQVSIWAVAYEFYDRPLVSDGQFDKRCLQVDTSIVTDRPDLDGWFSREFDPCTGAWAHTHPELSILKDRVLSIFSHLDSLEGEEDE